jgi:hypothetical protein
MSRSLFSSPIRPTVDRVAVAPLTALSDRYLYVGCIIAGWSTSH